MGENIVNRDMKRKTVETRFVETKMVRNIRTGVEVEVLTCLDIATFVSLCSLTLIETTNLGENCFPGRGNTLLFLLPCVAEKHPRLTLVVTGLWLLTNNKSHLSCNNSMYSLFVCYRCSKALTG